VFFALGVVAFPMMFGRGAMGFGSIFVMFSSFIVLVSSHWVSPAKVRGTQEQLRMSAFGSWSEPALFPSGALVALSESGSNLSPIAVNGLE
jgi:hypothetical protein